MPLLRQIANLFDERLAVIKMLFNFTTNSFLASYSFICSTVDNLLGCLFIWLNTPEIQIEVLHYLSTDSFLLVSERIVDPRGVLFSVQSDNYRSFAGILREIREFAKSFKVDKVIKTHLSSRSCGWENNPLRLKSSTLQIPRKGTKSFFSIEWLSSSEELSLERLIQNLEPELSKHH